MKTLLVDSREAIGSRFGRLTILGRPFRIRSHTGTATMFVCQCDCGKVRVVSANNLRRGNTKSCGCHSRDATALRNRANTNPSPARKRLKNIWWGMIRRCTDARHPSYRWYGAKGVHVCAEWLADFEAFHSWALANGYAEHLSIDRIENALVYSPATCRWATLEEQENHRTNNVRVMLWGETKTLAQWLRDPRVRINPFTARGRIARGQSPVAALTSPA